MKIMPLTLILLAVFALVHYLNHDYLYLKIDLYLILIYAGLRAINEGLSLVNLFLKGLIEKEKEHDRSNV